MLTSDTIEENSKLNYTDIKSATIKMKKVIVYGNGESRLGKVGPTSIPKNVETWGCNAIYRDMKVDNLVSVDYNMQQEIYESGYAHNNKCWFSDWNILPNVDDAMIEISKSTFNSHLIKETERKNRKNCIIQGKDPATVEMMISDVMKANPKLDYNDVKLKAERDIGLFITWVDEEDKVKGIDYPIGWCAGATALHLACQGGAKDIYMLGFDNSSYDTPINNIYKGSKNYLPEYAKGFNPVNWNNQLDTVFKEYNGLTKFWWVNPVHTILDKVKSQDKNPNVDFLTYEELYKNIS